MAFRTALGAAFASEKDASVGRVCFGFPGLLGAEELLDSVEYEEEELRRLTVTQPIRWYGGCLVDREDSPSVKMRNAS